jgi:hypothetical protein
VKKPLLCTPAVVGVLKESGLSISEISKKTKEPQSLVRRYLRVWEDAEPHDRLIGRDGVAKYLKIKPMKIRTAVMRFAEAMELKLRENDHKGNVTQVRFDYALDRVWDEVRELDRAGFGHINIGTTKKKKAQIKLECVDVANFAMMAWFGAEGN